MFKTRLLAAGLAVGALILLVAPASAQVDKQQWTELNFDVQADIKRGKKQIAIQRMGSCPDVRAKKMLIEYLKKWEQLMDLRREFIKAIAKTTHPASLDYYVKLMTDKKEPTWVKFEVAAGIARMPSEGSLALLKSWVGHEKINVRLAGLYGLGNRFTNEDVKGAIAVGLKDEYWQVRFQAMESLLRIKDPQAAPKLFTLLTDVRGREEFDVLRALKSLTGGTKRTLEEWVGWWSKAGRYRTKLPGDRHKMFMDDKSDIINPDDKPPYRGPEFFGVKVVSRRVMFLLDMSTKLEEMPFKGKLPADYKGEEIKTLKDLVIEELVGCIQEFAPDVQFFIRYCDSQAQPWKRKWTSANEETKAEAIKSLRSKTTTGRTDLIKPLKLAYTTSRKGKPDDPTNYKDGPDTIFLVTRGYPNTGKIPYRKVALRGQPKWSTRILTTVWNWNLVRKVRYYVVGLGLSPARELLQGLTEGNGGKYIPVDGR